MLKDELNAKLWHNINKARYYQAKSLQNYERSIKDEEIYKAILRLCDQIDKERGL